MPTTNPLLRPWDGPLGLPAFREYRAEHFAPAFEASMAEHRAEIDAIARQDAAPSFESTIVAFDCSGATLHRVDEVFQTLTASATSPELQEVERRMAPALAAHDAAIRLDARLFARIDDVHERRARLGLGPEQLRLVERIHQDFVLAGARLGAEAKARLAAIGEELASLTTRFAQNVLADESTFQLPLVEDADFAGLPESVREAARAAARERGIDGAVVTLGRSLVMPFLTFSSRRDLRQRAFEGWSSRGEGRGEGEGAPERDNRALIVEIVRLRAEQAQLMGYPTYAHLALADRMAATPEAAGELLSRAWGPAREKALVERQALAETAAAMGEDTDVQPWDWRRLAERVRRERHAFDESELEPYLALDQVTAAAFDSARRLFGVEFVLRPEIEGYHPDVKVYEVRRHGRAAGVFLHDNFSRPSKRSGAWMSSLRLQSRVRGEVLPIVVNNSNFARAPEGSPTLLSIDDARTLFHELGHGLHGLLSAVTYERLSGTRVVRDYVELPSQLFEHWLLEPEILRTHARHHGTGEPVPMEAVERMKRARRFNQGFEAVEYLASAILDMALHSRTSADALDPSAFEREELKRLEMPRGVTMRHRLPHFLHLFSDASYAAGYYSYIWAEVLEADAFQAFREAGDAFDASVAARLLEHVYSAGALCEAGDAYRAFRGRDADVQPMLVQRGLVDGESSAA